MSVLILSILVQVALIIHVVKTGRNQIWIWVLALLSLPGALAYIAVEILPELLRSRAAQRTARATLDELIRHNPDFRSPAGHLLYARALEAEGNVPKALEEYAVLAPSYAGAEASVRYAQLLQAQGRRAEAQKVARELLEQARIAPGHYRRAPRPSPAGPPRRLGCLNSPPRPPPPARGTRPRPSRAPPPPPPPRGR